MKKAKGRCKKAEHDETGKSRSGPGRGPNPNIQLSLKHLKSCSYVDHGTPFRRPAVRYVAVEQNLLKFSGGPDSSLRRDRGD